MENRLFAWRGGDNGKGESAISHLVKMAFDGHPYIDLRSNGKKPIFFCVLCWVCCYGPKSLSSHLDGKLHKRRRPAAMVTLDKENPWPFDDGVRFYFDSSDVSGNGSTIPGVLWKDGIAELQATYLGAGQIAARVCHNRNGPRMKKIWCEWLGRGGDEAVEHAFDVVTFEYNYDLGIKGIIPDLNIEQNIEHIGTREWESLFDPFFDWFNDQLLKGFSKTMRKQIRKWREVASGRTCDICDQVMIPGKDVAALLNKSSGRLACSRRNRTGAFHVFHVSCLIHWLLICEVSAIGVFCPQCRGTGVRSNMDEREKPTVSRKIDFYKTKARDGHQGWMKSPELLQNCSTGFCFPDDSEEIRQDTVLRLKLLRFYRASHMI